MTIEMKKVWFDDEKVVTQNIPESDIYKRHWDIASCKAYAEQLRDKNRANTAEHAAQAIEFLLAECDALHKEIDGNHAMLERQTARIVDLQTHIDNFDGEDRWVMLTDEEILECWNETHPAVVCLNAELPLFARAILRKAQEK